MINENKIYVDKTKFIEKMLDQGRKYYFLSRPRRFGKTLFISTLKNFFEGNKELFQSTYIYDNWKEWDKHQVIRISMKQVSNENPKVLKEDLSVLVRNIAEENNIKLSEDGSYTVKFSNLIKELSKNNENKVVVLIDEYDAPILSNLDNMDLANKNRRILQEFYNVLKESEEYLKFVFIAGLSKLDKIFDFVGLENRRFSKFTKVSVFSTFNNLKELSLDDEYSTICGITHNELENNYHKHIQLMADENNYTYDEAVAKFNHFYDGYSWDGINQVFNPYSTLNALDEMKFLSFWFSTGTPTFIAEIFKNRKVTENYTKSVILKHTDLDAIDPNNVNETTFLFQSGYLTIDEKIFENDEMYYKLKIPNFEVEQAYTENLKKLYLNEFKDKYTNIREKLWDDINNGRCNNLANRLQDDININPSYLNIGAKENWKIYESMFLMWMNIMGFDMTGEKLIKHGRIDGVFKDYDNNHVVICEVKYNQSSSKSLDESIEEALAQLKDKRYWMGYTTRKISLMAIAFKDEIIYDDKTMTLVKCKIEDFNPEQFLENYSISSS